MDAFGYYRGFGAGTTKERQKTVRDDADVTFRGRVLTVGNFYTFAFAFLCYTVSQKCH